MQGWRKAAGVAVIGLFLVFFGLLTVVGFWGAFR